MIVGKPWLKCHNPTIDWTYNSITFSSHFCHAHCLPARPPVPTPVENQFKINIISRAAFCLAIQDPESRLCIAAIYATPEYEEEPAMLLVPPEYQDYLLLSSDRVAKALPLHRYVDHTIPLLEGAKPPFGRM